MHISFLKKIVCLFVIMVFVEGRSASKIDEYYKLPPYSFQIAVLKYNGVHVIFGLKSIESTVRVGPTT